MNCHYKRKHKDFEGLPEVCPVEKSLWVSRYIFCCQLFRSLLQYFLLFIWCPDLFQGRVQRLYYSKPVLITFSICIAEETHYSKPSTWVCELKLLVKMIPNPDFGAWSLRKHVGSLFVNWPYKNASDINKMKRYSTVVAKSLLLS